MSLRAPDLELQLMHRHKDGSWAEMDATPSHHAPTEHDPERGWSRRKIFRCRTCAEVLSVQRGDTDVQETEAGH